MILLLLHFKIIDSDFFPNLPISPLNGWVLYVQMVLLYLNMLFRTTHVHVRQMFASMYIHWGLSWLMLCHSFAIRFPEDWGLLRILCPFLVESYPDFHVRSSNSHSPDLIFCLIHQSSTQCLYTRILPGKPVPPTPTVFHGTLNESTSLSPFEEFHSYQYAFHPLYLKYWNVNNALFNKTHRGLSYYVKVRKTLLELLDHWHKMIKETAESEENGIFFFFYWPETFFLFWRSLAYSLQHFLSLN